MGNSSLNGESERFLNWVKILPEKCVCNVLLLLWPCSQSEWWNFVEEFVFEELNTCIPSVFIVQVSELFLRKMLSTSNFLTISFQKKIIYRECVESISQEAIFFFFPWKISLKVLNLVCPWLLNSSVKKLIVQKTPKEPLIPHFKISKENFYPENKHFVFASLWFCFSFFSVTISLAQLQFCHES